MMKVGDLVRSLKSESGMLGIIVGWHPRLVVAIHETARDLFGIHWTNGETRYVHYKHLEVVNESR